MISKFNLEINGLVSKVDKTIEDLKFNVTISHFYEIYKIFIKYIDTDVSNESLLINISKTMKLMIPFTPYLAYECLEKLNCENPDKWPEILSNELKIVKFAIQVNGKTRDILNIESDLNKDQISKIVLEKSKAKKYIENKKIVKTIFVKNRIMNYIIKS